MGKFTDALGTFENFKAPWETDAGSTEIDEDRLELHIYNLSLDKAKAQDARDDEAAKVTKAEQETKDAKAEAAKADTTGALETANKEIDRLKTEVDSEKAKSASAALDIVRRDVAAEKGLTLAQAKRLQGATKDELEADADEVIKEFGITKADSDGDDGDDDEGVTPPAFGSPFRLTSGGSGKGRTSRGEVDYDEAAATIRAGRVL